MTMPLTHAAEKANFRMLNAKPFRYHVPKHKWNILQKTQLSSVVRFGLLFLMFLLGFIGATGQGSDAFSQSHEAQLIAHRDLSPNSEDILLSRKRSSKENHKMIADEDIEKHEKEDYNHSTLGKSKSQFLDRKESRRSDEKNNIELEHIQFDTYEGDNDKDNEENNNFKSASSQEPMTLAQDFKAKLIESRSQLLPVVPIQLPSPDASHKYHYTDDYDSEFNSFSQFTSSNDNFLFGNSSTTKTPKPKKKKKRPQIHKFVFSDMTEDPEESEDEEEEEDEDEHIKKAALPILKTKQKKRKIPSTHNKNQSVKTNSSDSMIVTSSSESFPSIHYLNNFLEEYPEHIGYNNYYTRPQHDKVGSYHQPYESERDRGYYDKHSDYNRPHRSRKPNYQNQYNYRISELNSNKYNDNTGNRNNHDRDEDEDIHIKGKESHRYTKLDEEEDEISEEEEEKKEKENALLENPDDEILRFPTIPNSTSALTSVVRHQILNQPLHTNDHKPSYNDEDEEDDYGLGTIASTLNFGQRETPKTYKSRHRNQQQVTNEATIRDDRRRRKNPARPFVKPEVNVREVDNSEEEIRDSKNNDDNQTEITNKLRDSFSSSVGSDDVEDDNKDFSNGNSNLDNIDTNAMMMRRRPRRSVVHLYDMVVCATGCNPLMYKGYGCYCGFLGSGLTVDGIDKCCAKHDWCYHHAKCPPLLTYFVPYYWTCNDNRPKCVTDYRGWKGICGTHLCECDRQFAECLRKFPCPRSRAMCMTSPWRFWQNLLMAPSPPYRYEGG